jgi:hypothetical protein
MPTVRLSFTPAPAHVRTARLVSVAVARRAGVAAEHFDEIRLAVGEACSRAVALHRQNGLPDLVEVLINDEAEFTVRVTDRAPLEAALGPALPDLTDPVALFNAGAEIASAASAELAAADDPGAGGADAATEEAVAAGVQLALLASVVDEISVRPVEDGPGTEVAMSWPTRPSRSASGRTLRHPGGGHPGGVHPGGGDVTGRG